VRHMKERFTAIELHLAVILSDIPSHLTVRIQLNDATVHQIECRELPVLRSAPASGDLAHHGVLIGARSDARGRGVMSGTGPMQGKRDRAGDRQCHGGGDRPPPGPWSE
jgi:hypothetical protein